MKNENKMEDMVLTHMHQYTPYCAKAKAVEVQGVEGSDVAQPQMETVHHVCTCQWWSAHGWKSTEHKEKLDSFSWSTGRSNYSLERLARKILFSSGSTYLMLLWKVVLRNIFRWYRNVCLGREIRILSWGRFHNYKQNKCPNWTNKQCQCSRGIFTGIHSCYTLKSIVQVVLQSYIIAAALKAFQMQSTNDNLPPSILCDLMQAPGALCWNKSN